MRKLLLMCLVSGFVGALMALSVTRDGPAMRLMAQERSAAIAAPVAGSSGADDLADFSAAKSEGCEFVGVDGSDELGNLDCLVVANLASLLLRFSNDVTRKT